MNNLDALTIEDLRLIAAIIEEGSLTNGAAKLRKEQSNASYALKNIRAAFQTDLFTKQGRKLIPNEFGWHVYSHIKTILAELAQVSEPPEFDPLSEFTLRFGATEYETIAVFPDILRMLKRKAPNARIQISAMDADNYFEQLERLDYVFFPEKIPSENTHSLHILDDRYQTYFDSSVRSEPSELLSFCRARHAIFSLDGTHETNIDHLLAAKGLQRDIVMSVFGFAALAGLLKNSDMITTLPSRFASGIFSELATCECPIETDPMPLYLCWSITKENSGKHKWFKSQIEKMWKKNI